MRGAGDRWLAGEAIEGVTFGLHDRVQVVGGTFDGAVGSIALLIGLSPEPSYLVSLGERGDVRVRQAELRPAA
jgi:sugar (pentulose or hexulose) kinase